jgi:hypothetical protein
MKIAGHSIESISLIKGLSVGLAISAGILGWMWRRKHSMGMQTNNNIFGQRGRRWPQAVPVK